MKSVQNIQKITKAMKMVAASKMRVAQLDTENSRGIVMPFYRLLGDLPGAEVEKNVTVPITSDKGLCGGINSTVAKISRGVLKATDGEGKTSGLVVFGEKGRAQLVRDRKDKIIETIADIGKVKITFSQVSLLAEDILKTEFDATRIIFNRFKSAISFLPTMATVLSPDTLEKEAEAGSAVDAYEIEGPDRAELLQDLAEFQLAATLYNGLLENNCSEQASRMAAMENSTKNASEMLGKLTLFYNRARQATITTELIEIISGAAALENK
jgi:F-type H+-transporting ATPase subunit gamma